MINYTEIVDDGATLRIKLASGQYTSIEKDQVSLKIADSQPDGLFINDLTGGSYFAIYSDVTSPATASAEQLRIAIEAMLDNVGTTPISGSVSVLNFPNEKNATATITRKTVTEAASVELLAANANRKGAKIFVESGPAMHIKYGTTATIIDYSTMVFATGGIDYDTDFKGYTGAIHAISSADDPDAIIMVTEW